MINAQGENESHASAPMETECFVKVNGRELKVVNDD